MMKNKSVGPVALVCFTTGTGGMPFDTIKLARQLQEKTGVYLICYRGTHLASIKDKIEEGSKIKVIVLDFNRYMSLKLVSPRLILAIRKIVSRHSIKNIIIFGTSELKSVYFSGLYKDVNILIRHGTTKTSRKNGFIYRLIYSAVNYHIAISKHLVTNINNIFPISPRSEVVMIYPSLNYEFALHRPPDNHEKLRILHTGRIAEGKGQSDAILACKALKEKHVDFELILVGAVDNERYYNILIQLAENEGLANNITFKGHVDNVIGYLYSSDIFLFPSYGEGFGNSTVEALASGIVCLAYNNTTFTEFSDLGFYIHLAENKDVVDLTNNLLRVVDNIDNEKNESLKNIMLARSVFNKEDELSKFLTILR